MISIISGLPGKGKNVLATYLAKKHFRSENSLFRRLIRSIKHEQVYINNVYTTYPILLNKRKKIYSNIVSINDLDGRYSFLYNALIIIDEAQAFYDSDEYKNFPKSIAVFNQFHRHFNIKDIYYISQHPSRIVKKLRNVSCCFTKVRRFRIIPIINLGIMYITNYYEFEDYGKWHHPDKEFKTYDVDNHFKIFFVRPIFKSYYSKYLNVLNRDKPLLNKGQFKYLDLTKEELFTIFGDVWTDQSNLKRNNSG